MSRFPTKTTRVNYQDITNYVSVHCRISSRKVSMILTSFSRIIQEYISRGCDVQIDTFCTIEYVSRVSTIYKNYVITLDDILAQMEQQLTTCSEIDVRNVVFTYIQHLQHLIRTGKQVNLKGICYIRITENTKGELYFDTRISGVLKKPEQAHFYILDKNGVLSLAPLEAEQLRLSIILDDCILLPSKVTKSTPLKLKTLNI